MKRKNILSITVRADIGGGPIHLNELISKLDLNKFNLFLACPLSGSIYSDHWKENNRITNLQEIPFRGFSFKSIFQLVKFVKNNDIDFIHSHGKGAGIYSRCIKMFMPKIKVIHTFHGINVFEKGLINSIKNIHSESFFKNFTSTFICVSNGERELAINYLKVDKNKINVIYNGVNDKSVATIKNPKSSVVSFSRFSYEKNMTDSYEIVKKTNSSIQFNWIGNGEEFNIIKERIENDKIDNLHLLGFKNKPQKYLVPGSIYLSTSRHEGLPLSLLEAEAYGIPIVASNVVGNNEVVIDGYNGFLFDQGDTDLAVEKIELLIENSDLYHQMSKNARTDYLKRFRVEKMVNETQKIYDEIFI